MNYWLLKTEPNTYSIDHLKKEKIGHWEGVRNYQARNYLRDQLKVGDLAFFYHSNCETPGIVGLCEVVKEGYPDYFAWNPKSKYFDPKSTPERPIWFMVDVTFKEKFPTTLSLTELKTMSELSEMAVVQRGSRLSVQPVSEKHFRLLMTTIKNIN